MNFCKDCRHFAGPPPRQFVNVLPNPPGCRHEKAMQPADAVWGNRSPGSAHKMRGEANLCGPSGAWFEKREPTPKPVGPTNAAVRWFARLWRS